MYLDPTECRSTDSDAKASELEGAEAQADLARANHVAPMDYLAACIVHEVKQPIAAMVINAQTALRWLDRPAPDVDEARQALSRIVRDGGRANALIGRVPDQRH